MTKNIFSRRLLLIAKQEKILTDLTSMLALADKTGNDVRACLSMLQFHSSLKKPLRLTDVLKSNVGQKDRHKGLFGIWSAIFQVSFQFYCLRLLDKQFTTTTIYFERRVDDALKLSTVSE